MKNKLQGLIIGLLIGTILASGMVFSKQISETAELFYNNIKIYIDGGEIVPKDANGNNVEPFTMNGTTYLPVRAIASAFNQEVEWDGTTQSIYIGKKDQTKPDNYLDKIQYNDYKESDKDNSMTIINGTLNDFNGNTYTSGILFYLEWGSIEDDVDKADVIASYPLNSQYKNLKGKIVLPKEYQLTTDSRKNCASDVVDVLFYGDGKLLYKATAVTASMPFNIDVNVTGVNQLNIKIASQEYTFVALTDLALYK